MVILSSVRFVLAENDEGSMADTNNSFKGRCIYFLLSFNFCLRFLFQ